MALSTYPLACGCATDAKSMLIPQSLAHRVNSFAVNGDPKSVMMLMDMPNLCMMSCINSIVFSVLYLTKGLYSIHLVNLSIATKIYLNPPFALFNGPTPSMRMAKMEICISSYVPVRAVVLQTSDNSYNI